MPAGFAKMTKGIGSWGWHTVPQKQLNGRVLRYTQAKVIGGGSSINAQLYTRGVPADYDEWVSEEGALGWSYREVLPYFKRAENNERFADEFHAYGGPLGVSNPISPLPICEAFFQAGQELGIPFNPDFNGARQEGLGYYQLTQLNARRSSTATGYLNPIRNRPNLSVMLETQVLRMVVDGGRAVGVEIASAGNRTPRVVRADREVIVASGAIGSPKLLLQSGIGPADHLRAVGVNVVHDLPGVGANLQDHLDLFVIAECTGDHTYDKYNKPHHAAWAGLQYLLLAQGPGGLQPVRDGRLLVRGSERATPRALARHPVPPGARLGHRGRRGEDAQRRRHLEQRLPAPQVARHGAARQRRPGRGTAHRSELLVRSARSGSRARGPAAGSRHHESAGVEALRARRGPAGYASWKPIRSCSTMPAPTPRPTTIRWAPAASARRTTRRAW